MMKDNKNLLIIISLFCIILFKRLLFLNIGINYEESRDLSSIIKVANGDVLYRDFEFSHGFLGVYFNALIFKVLGVTNIIIPRLIVSIFFAVSSIFAYKIALRFLSPFWAFVAVLLGFSGLVTREHVYGHIFAFFGIMVALWAGLSYIYDEKIRNLGYSGMASGIALISKPLPLGILSAFTLVCLLVYKHFFTGHSKGLQPYLIFAFSLLLFPIMGISYFFWNNAFWVFLESTFLPMFTAQGPHPSHFFFLPSIIPDDLFAANSLSELKTILNIYIYKNLRWWLISVFFVTGTGYSIFKLYKNKRDKHYLSILFLSAFSIVFEIQRILIHGLNPYVSLFPTFVLLIYFGVKINRFYFAKLLVKIMIFFLFILYFVYTPVIYYINYEKDGVPLGLKPASNVIVMPFTREVYQEATVFINNNTGEEDKIVVADYNLLFHIFSNRKNLFSKNYLIFFRTTFHPIKNSFSLSVEMQFSYENEIIAKIKKEKPALVIVPTKFLIPELVEQSIFLKHITRNWKKCKEIDPKSKKNMFEAHISITIFCPPASENNFPVL